jgi:hypothetical protein
MISTASRSDPRGRRILMSVMQEEYGPQPPAEAEPLWPLIQRAQQGDRAAFEELHVLFAPATLQVIKAKLTERGDVWDDVNQELWLTFWTGLGNYHPDAGPFASYIRRSARNKAIDWLRWKYRDPLIGLPDGLEDEVEPPPGPVLTLSGKPDPVAVCRALAIVVFEGESKPYQIVAWGFAHLLLYAVDTIVTELAGVPLRALAARLESEYLAKARDSRVAAAFARFKKRIPEEDSIAVHFGKDPKKDVPHWGQSVQRAAREAVMKTKREFVAAVFHVLPPDGSLPHESLTFAFIRLLRHDGAMFWERDSATCLGPLADRFITGYRAIAGLSETILLQATAEMTQVLGWKMNVICTFRRARLPQASLHRVAAATKLEDYASDSPQDSMVAWLDAVQSRLNRDGRSGAAWLVYGYVRGYLESAPRLCPGGKHAIQ